IPAADWSRHAGKLQPSGSAPIDCRASRDESTGGRRSGDSAPRQWATLHLHAAHGPETSGQSDQMPRHRQGPAALHQNRQSENITPEQSIELEVPKTPLPVSKMLDSASMLMTRALCGKHLVYP